MMRLTGLLDWLDIPKGTPVRSSSYTETGS